VYKKIKNTRVAMYILYPKTTQDAIYIKKIHLDATYNHIFNDIVTT